MNAIENPSVPPSESSSSAVQGAPADDVDDKKEKLEGLPRVLAILLIPLVHLLLVSPTLMPTIPYVNPYDEAKYVESGWILLSHGFRDLGWGPLVAFVYAPVDLLVGGSPDWFMIELWAGRYILFLALWFAAFQLMTHLQPKLSPWVVCGTLFVALPFSPILENQSDALFVALSMLGLARFLAFLHHHRPVDLCVSSMLVGLGVLVRVESVLLMAILAILAILTRPRDRSPLGILLRGLLPAVIVFALFVIANLLISGAPNISIGGRAYDSLTGGEDHPLQAEMERLYGSREENEESVVRAILRNPAAFAGRIPAALRGIPDSFLEFFGKRVGPVLAIFAAWGVYSLAKTRRFRDIGIMVVWAAPAAIYLVFFTRHIIPQTFYLPLALAATGVAFAFSRRTRVAERIGVLLSMLVLFVWGILGKPALLPGGILVGLLVAVDLLAGRIAELQPQRPTVPLFLLLAVGIVLRGPFSFPNYPCLGCLPEEQATHFMQQTLPRRSYILVPSPRPAVAAKMLEIRMESAPRGLTETQQLWGWMQEKGVRAAYVDSAAQQRPDVVSMLEAGEGTLFELGYSSEDGGVRVYLPLEAGPIQPSN